MYMNAGGFFLTQENEMNKHYCTHGTLLASYCHECTTPEPTTAEATIERVRVLPTQDHYVDGYCCGECVDQDELDKALEKQE